MVFKPDEVIRTQTRLREILREPDPRLLEQDLDHINEVARAFIALSPFLVITTKGRDGLMDISPKGDSGGFVEVWDEKTLIIPDRLGNNRADTFDNLLHDPAIGLFFLIPGHNISLRVSGAAQIILDRGVQERFAVNGREPLLALSVTVEQAFMQCSKCLVRSQLWNEESWADHRNAPNLADWADAIKTQENSMDEVPG